METLFYVGIAALVAALVYLGYVLYKAIMILWLVLGTYTDDEDEA